MEYKLVAERALLMADLMVYERVASMAACIDGRLVGTILGTSTGYCA
jgi:hypothetical protein